MWNRQGSRTFLLKEEQSDSTKVTVPRLLLFKQGWQDGYWERKKVLNDICGELGRHKPPKAGYYL